MTRKPHVEGPDFDRIAHERQFLREAREDRETIKLLCSTLRMVLENQGGHQHWDSFGTAGANCPICQRQMEAATQAWEVLRSLQKPAKPYDPLRGVRMPLGIILDWYEQNDELPDESVRRAFGAVNAALGIPEK